MTSQEQQRTPKVLTAAYKCRRCSEIETGPSGGHSVVFQGLVEFTVNPMETYSPRGGGLGIGMFSVHHCQDGGLGISDLLGADPDD